MLEKNNLKKLREYFSLTQQELAEKLDLSESMIKKIEGGESQISIKTASKIIQEFCVSLDWLYGLSEHMSEKDLSIEVLYGLSKIFMMSKRVNHNGEDVVLLMDYRFRDFLFDIDSLNAATELYLDNDIEFYDDLRRKKFLKHREYLKAIFSEAHFNENYAIEIHGVGSIDITDLDNQLLSVLGAETLKNIIYNQEVNDEE